MTGADSALPAVPRHIARFLAKSGIRHRVVSHALLGGEVQTPDDVARLLPIGIDRIAKTLLVVERPGSQRAALVVLPVCRRLDLDATARALNWTEAVLASRAALADLVGQPVHGVSPFGAPDGVVVLVDLKLCGGPEMLVGAGVPGLEVEIEPDDLVRSTGAIIGDVGVSNDPDRGSG